MSDLHEPSGSPHDNAQDGPPACVMSFNAADPTGASGSAGDVTTIAAMGAHPLPVITSLWIRDTAEIFDQHALDPDAVAEQARPVLEDGAVHAFKVGFLGTAENVSAVAEIVADYPDVPVVAYMPNVGWMDDDDEGSYCDAFRELILPAATVLVGNHKTLSDLLLPEWDSERPPSARELAVAAAEFGARHVLVTGVVLGSRGQEHHIDNVLASPEGAISGEKFERFEVTFLGAGDTLSASVASMLANGMELPDAVSEALSFLDQSLEAGFRTGMGHVVPDRLFWAGPAPDGEEADGAEVDPELGHAGSRRIH